MVKRLFRKARKKVKKLIPKEIRPALPFIAAAAPIPGIGNLAARGIADQFIKAALVRAATDDEADLKDVLRTGTLAAAPQAIGKGIMKAVPVDAFQDLDKLEKFRSGVERFSKPEGRALMDTAKTVGLQTGVEVASKLKEIEQDQIDAYNRKLKEDGIRSKAERRTAIRNIYTGIGYDEDYVDSMLDRFGYKEGGGVMAAASMQGYGEFHRKYKKNKDKKRVKKASGGMTEARSALFASLLDRYPEATIEEIREMMDKEFPETAEEKLSIADYADLAEEGFKSGLGVESLFPQAPKPMGITPGFGNLPRMADGGDVMSPEEYFKEKDKFKKRKSMDDMMREYEEYLYKQKYGPRDSAAEGGLMNLGGNEMDLRGGGFVPIGKKEKADDVPARLSKNEFVMTADAVRGAGGGDVNEGARRMYQTMDKLEAMA